MTKRPKIRIHPLLAVASIVIIVAGMREIASVLNIFLVALLLAVSISPILIWQIKRGWPKTVSLVATIFIVLVVTAGLSAVLGVAVNNMAEKAPEYQERITVLYQSTLKTLSEKGIKIDDIQQLDMFSPEKLINFGTGFIENLFSTFGNVFFVLVLMIFILIEIANLTIKADRGEFDEDSWQNRFSYISNDLKKYVSINAVTGLMAALCDLVLLLIIGIDFAVIWAFLSFFFSFIPNIGFFMSLIPPALIALLEFGWIECLAVIVGYVVINLIIDNVIKPKYLGKEFNMSILLVFLSLLFWGWVLGAVGAVLGVPMTMAVKKIVTFMNKDIEAQYAVPIPESPSPEFDPEDEG